MDVRKQAGFLLQWTMCPGPGKPLRGAWDTDAKRGLN